MISFKNKIARPGKEFILKEYWRYRESTWKLRREPDFLIIGAQKSGTTSLHSYLTQHPQIIGAFKKEIHYFNGGFYKRSDDFIKGEKWYRAHYPMSFLSYNMISFEATPLYLFNPLAARRIAEFKPDIKLIVILRNPINRALSHYFHSKRVGKENLALIEALKIEESRLYSVLKDKDYKHESFIYHSYKSRGYYKYQIEVYLKYHQAKNLLILCFEDFFRDPNNSLKKIYEFIGVDNSFQVGNLTPSNQGSVKDKIDLEAYEYLKDHFELRNKELYEFLGVRMPW